MATIDTLQQVLRAQAHAAAEHASDLVLRDQFAEQVPTRRRLVPALSAVAVALLALGVSLGVAHHHRSSGALSGRTSAPAVSEPAPLVLSAAGGLALTHDTLTVRAPITNVTTDDLALTYPMQFIGPDGQQLQVAAAVLTTEQTDVSSIDSDEPVPTTLSHLASGNTEDLWFRIDLNCTQVASARSWGDSFPKIRIAFAGSRPPAELAFSDLQSGVPGHVADESYAQLLARACNR